MIMVTGSRTAESKNLLGIGIKFDTRQEIDDFVKKLDLKLKTKPSNK